MVDKLILTEAAKKYTEAGLSIIPIGESKVPPFKWNKSQVEVFMPDLSHDRVIHIGLVCGKVSGNIELIDIDEKYSLDGKLCENFKKLIHETDKNILKKLTVQKTPSGGYHFIYRCSVLEGNKKLANRPTTDEEKAKNENDKRRVLIETRGEGGYACIAPDEGYEFVYGDLFHLNEITPEERETLMLCAKSFNQCFDEPFVKTKDKKIYEADKSPFEDYNEKANVIELLEEHGWKVTMQRGNKCFLLRPGGTGKWSADWSEQHRKFYVFTSSTQFDECKAYNPSAILALLQFNNDWSETAKWLLKNGYGKFTPEPKQRKEYKPLEVEPKISADDDDYSFLATKEETDIFITQKRNGTFKMGNTTGFERLDKYWRNKDAQLDMILGHDNSGKTTVTLYLAVLDVLYNKGLYLIFCGENSNGSIKSTLMQFYLDKLIDKMNDREFEKAKAWVEANFYFIKNDEAYTYKDMIAIGKKMMKVRTFTKFIIEPYNVLDKSNVSNEHQYDYIAMRDLRLFIKKTGCGITLNVHAATEALRRVYPKGHVNEGCAMPPNKSDAEGGGKYPNKADNFMTVHRLAESKDDWMWTQLHIQKIKENETGGKRTFKDDPFKIKLNYDHTGFEDDMGNNPVQIYWSRNQNKQIEIPPLPESLKPLRNFTEPLSEQDKDFDSFENTALLSDLQPQKTESDIQVPLDEKESLVGDIFDNLPDDDEVQF